MEFLIRISFLVCLENASRTILQTIIERNQNTASISEHILPCDLEQILASILKKEASTNSNGKRSRFQFGPITRKKKRRPDVRGSLDDEQSVSEYFGFLDQEGDQECSNIPFSDEAAPVPWPENGRRVTSLLG